MLKFLEILVCGLFCALLGAVSMLAINLLLLSIGVVSLNIGFSVTVFMFFGFILGITAIIRMKS